MATKSKQTKALSLKYIFRYETTILLGKIKAQQFSTTTYQCFLVYKCHVFKHQLKLRSRHNTPTFYG